MKGITSQIICIHLFFASTLSGYDQPFINLGFTNMLDGGPVRPTYGWYVYQFFQYYGAHKFMNAQGSLVGGTSSPHTTVWDSVTSLTYQTKHPIILGAKTGVSAGIPIIFYSTISPNALGFLDSGTGFGDIYGGPFLQWNPIIYKDRPLFVTRIEFDVSLPCGKFNKHAAFNPGNGLYFINPYWAATLYFPRHLAASWRLQYVWSSFNKKTHTQPGQAIFMNFDLEYELHTNCWAGVVGYFLQQITDSKINKVAVPGRKEFIVALGPGLYYERTFSHDNDLFLFGYVFFEFDAKNRTQGINAIGRFVYHF